MMVGKTSARSRVSKGGGVGVTAHEPLAVEIERRFMVKLDKSHIRMGSES